jgi:urease accessory protein
MGIHDGNASCLPSHLLALLQLCDAALPTGAYAFSNGGDVHQQGLMPAVATLQEWLEAVLHHTLHGSHLLPVASP